MEHGAGEILGKEEVGAAAHDHYGLGQGVEVQGLEFFFGLNLNVQRTPYLHAEGVSAGKVIVTQFTHFKPYLRVFS